MSEIESRLLEIQQSVSSPPKGGNKRKLKREQNEAAHLKIEEDKRNLEESTHHARHLNADFNDLEKVVGGVSRKGLRLSRELDLKRIIDVNLWVNGVPYDYGILCTFCTTEKASVNCPECADFFCSSCDFRNHDVKKRRAHLRSKLSRLSKDDAAKLCTFAVRYHGHLKTLQTKCRKKFRRYLDSSTAPLNESKGNPRCYYYNTVYSTSSWHKPYCLRGTDLVPLMDSHVAASKIQGLYRMMTSRVRTIDLMILLYRKIFDRLTGKFYYAFNGKSVLISRQQWKRPRLCGARGYSVVPDIGVLYTVDISAIKIQNKWRSVLVRNFLKSLTRSTYVKSWDPSRGDYGFYRKDTNEHFKDKKPLMLGSEKWDLNYIPEWSQYKVALFLRRIGFKRYAGLFFDYGVDGKVLLRLNDEDFENLTVTSVIHRKKILVEMERVCPLGARGLEVDIDDLHIKRERIRNLKRRSSAVCVIQNLYRRYAGKQLIQRMKLLVNMRIKEHLLDAKIEASRGWWTEMDVPSKSFKPYTGLLLTEEERRKRRQEDALEVERKHEDVGATRSLRAQGDSRVASDAPNSPPKRVLNTPYFSLEKSLNTHGSASSAPSRLSEGQTLTNGTSTDATIGERNRHSLPISSCSKQDKNIMSSIGISVCGDRAGLHTVQFPEIKTFGRKVDRMTIRGWGKFDDRGAWLPALCAHTESAADASYEAQAVVSNNFAADINGNSTIVHNSSVRAFNVTDDMTRNSTLLLTQKLRTSGYEKRRLEIFLQSRWN